MMKALYLFFLCLTLFSCNKKTADDELIQGRVADAKWFFHNADTLLWVYSLYNTEHTEYSSSSIDKTSTYLHENSKFTVFRLKNNTLNFVYQQEPGCINHQECGTRYTDRIIAYSSGLLAFNCLCEGKLIITDIASGKEWANLSSLKTKFKELNSGILKYSSFPARPEILQLELSDGKIAYLSLEAKTLTDWDKSFDWGSEVNRGSRMAHSAGQKIYFAPNDGDHRSFLVVRSEKSGTSQDYKHQMGNEYWLNPVILNKLNSTEAYVKDEAFFVLHSKAWNEYGDTDLLSKINTKGETLFTIALKPLGKILNYFVADQQIYINGYKELHVFDANTGKKLNTIFYNRVSYKKANSAVNS